ARLQTETRRLARELQELKVKSALGVGREGGGAREDAVQIGDVRAVFRAVAGLDKAALRELADSLRGRLKSGVVVLASTTPDGKVAIIASVTPDLKGRLHAGTIVK